MLGTALLTQAPWVNLLLVFLALFILGAAEMGSPRVNLLFLRFHAHVLITRHSLAISIRVFVRVALVCIGR